MSAKLYDNIYLETLQIFFDRTKHRGYDLLNPLSDETIADIGCGVGQDVINLAKSGAKVIGIDHDSTFVELAKKREADNLQIEFICSQADDIPLDDYSIDKVRFDRVFQHIANHEKVLKEVSRILKPNGQLQIIDTDYLSFTLFLADEKLERKIIDAIAYKRIPNGHKVRRLPKTLEGNNFTLVSTEIHNYVITDYDFAKSLIRFHLIVDEQLENGNITLSDYNYWQDYTSSGQFNWSLNMMIFTARPK